MKGEEYAKAGIDAYLIADPLRGTCKPYGDPVDCAYQNVTDFVLGDGIRFVADETKFILDTPDWPRVR